MSSTTDRIRLIRLIHVARRELQMPDDSYRHVLRTVAGKESAADLNIRQLQDVVDHLKKAGFKVRVSGNARTPQRQSRPLASEPDHKKIRAIWLMLADMGVVRDSSERALAAYCRRLTGVEALQWINAAQAHKLIESLKKWALRYLPGQVELLAGQVDWKALSGHDQDVLRRALHDARLRGTYDPLQSVYDLLCQHMEARNGKST